MRVSPHVKVQSKTEGMMYGVNRRVVYDVESK